MQDSDKSLTEASISYNLLLPHLLDWFSYQKRKLHWLPLLDLDKSMLDTLIGIVIPQVLTKLIVLAL